MKRKPFTDVEKAEMRRLSLLGLSNGKIAARFGTSNSSVQTYTKHHNRRTRVAPPPSPPKARDLARERRLVRDYYWVGSAHYDELAARFGFGSASTLRHEVRRIEQRQRSASSSPAPVGVGRSS